MARFWFSRVTRSDLEEVKDTIEALGNRIERLVKSAKAKRASEVGLNRRVKNIEEYLTTLSSGIQPDPRYDEEEAIDDEAANGLDRESLRIGLGRGDG